MRKNSRSKERLREAEHDPVKQDAVSRVFSIMRELSAEKRQRQETRPSRRAVESFSDRVEYQHSGGFTS